MLTANAPWVAMAASVWLDRSKQTSSSGGSRERELTALAVVPTGRLIASIEVTTVTPVAKWPMACRSAAAVTSVSVVSSVQVMASLLKSVLGVGAV
jgi:hypothetical protein